MRYYQFFLVLFFCVTTSAQSQQCLPHITVHNAWARASHGQNSAVFMRLQTSLHSLPDLKLINAESEVSKVVELHNHTKEGSVYSMRKISAIHLPPRHITELKPGGLHIMLIHLLNPLQEGKFIPVKLYFSNKQHCVIKAKVSLRPLP